MHHTTPHAATPPGVIRLGYHGSPALSAALLRKAGIGMEEAQLLEHDVADPFRALRAGELDLMVVKFSLGQAEPDLRRSRPVAHDARAVLVSADHPLATRASVSIEDVADYGVFDCPGTMPVDVWEESVPRTTPSGRTVRRTHTLVDVPQMLTVVRAGEAVHLSLASLAAVVPKDVKAVPVHDLPPAPVALAWCAERGLPPHIERFVRAAEAAAEQ
ncbi:substrate-binding domain-containing protein [Streptomyces sp. NPDC012825]|uniref:substrate-binding domain-containing protein n=1 Tax=Streptomyces sp. NPDC012825 TaxID=3364851 RepID=UPI00368C5977